MAVKQWWVAFLTSPSHPPEKQATSITDAPILTHTVECSSKLMVNQLLRNIGIVRENGMIFNQRKKNLKTCGRDMHHLGKLIMLSRILGMTPYQM